VVEPLPFPDNTTISEEKASVVTILNQIVGEKSSALSLMIFALNLRKLAYD
jgi:hypothetical protein